AISSAGAEASWHSTTSRSSGPIPASRYASAAHTSTVPGSSGAWSQPEWSTLATTRTGFATPSRRARARLITTTAAAPSPIGEHLLHREPLAKLRARVEAPVLGILRRHHGEVALRRPVALHVGAGDGGIE